MTNNKRLLAHIGALAVFLSSSAQAMEPPSVILGGKIETFLGGRHQPAPYDKRYTFSPGYTISPKVRNTAIANDTKIDLNVKSPKDCAFAYGALIRLNADASDATSDEASIADKTMFFVQSNNFGRLEGGNYPGAGAMFEMDITSYSKAAYGIDGYWLKWVNDVSYIDLTALTLANVPLSGIMGFRYIASPNLPSNYSGFSYSDAPKLTYYTKPFDALTVGVSYIPDLDNTGTIAGVALRDQGAVDAKRAALGYRPTFENIVSGGLQYKHSMKNAAVTVSLAGEIGKAKHYNGTDYIRDLHAYELGGVVSYKTYSFGASYGNWGKTGTYRQAFAGTKQGASYWTLVASQQLEKLGYSVTYIQSKRAGGLEAIGSQITNIAISVPLKLQNFSDSSYNKFRAASAGVQYLVAPGMLPFAEATVFRMNSAQETPSNKGYVVLTGLRLTF